MVETDVNGWRCSKGLGKVANAPEDLSMDAFHETVPENLTSSGLNMDGSGLKTSRQRREPNSLYIPDTSAEEDGKEEMMKGNDDDDDDEDSDASSTATTPTATKKKTRGRVKIGFKLIEQKQRRCATFHKRRKGLMKKVGVLRCFLLLLLL